MSQFRTEPTPVLLDPETWEVPSRLSVDDLYLQVGADQRASALEDREDDR